MYLFYFDSGTTNSRGYLLKDGKILHSGKLPLGSKDVSQTGDRELLPRGLKNLYDRVLAEVGISDREIEKIYGSGMLSCPFGLTEVPHTLTPFGARELAEAIYPFPEEKYFKRTIYIIPGGKTAEGKLTLRQISSVNNMRGEEIEAMGIKNFLPSPWRTGKYIILFPGSHTHALLFDGQKVIDIFSNFSGEVFHALTTATILSGSTKVEAEAPLPDAGSVEMGLQALKEYGFARAVYIVHATKIFDVADNRQRRDMLSAIITGTVFQSLSLHLEQQWQDVSRLAVYGDAAALFTCRQAAARFTPDLEFCSVSNQQTDRVCSVEGLLQIIKEEKTSCEKY